MKKYYVIWALKLFWTTEKSLVFDISGLGYRTGFSSGWFSCLKRTYIHEDIQGDAAYKSKDLKSKQTSDCILHIVCPCRKDLENHTGAEKGSREGKHFQKGTGPHHSHHAHLLLPCSLSQVHYLKWIKYFLFFAFWSVYFLSPSSPMHFTMTVLTK